MFDLPPELAAKAAPGLVAADAAHLAALARTLARRVADLEARRAELRLRTDRVGQLAMDRDLEVHRTTARLRHLRRFGPDVCLGRTVTTSGERTYVGRIGLTAVDGTQVLVDWRSPAAEPFFAATHQDPLGLRSRRRYRWRAGRVVDYWDEVFDPDALAAGEGAAALDDQSAFVASLGASRTARMRDVLATIQADQDAIVRAPSPGVLVVDGGPGTGKTVVALHRTAYLLHADPRLDHRRGGVLLVGPHQPYLRYVEDVLPSLGEEGVQTATLRDLVPEGAGAGPEPDAEVARLKGSVALVDAIEPAVRLYEDPPRAVTVVETAWGDLRVGPQEWEAVFDAATGTPHNEAREVIHEALADLLLERVVDQAVGQADEPAGARGAEPVDGDETRVEALRVALLQHAGLRRVVRDAWPLIAPTDLVADLWDVPAYLRRCAPSLTPDEVRTLRREDPYAWTEADLPLLDAARARLGDPALVRDRRRREVAVRVERARMDRVVDELVAADPDATGLAPSLRQEGLRQALVETDVVDVAEADRSAGPFVHVVVDEAQELTDAQWRMVQRRCPSGSLTVVGDRAQARRGFPGTWAERLDRVGLQRVRVARLGVNYRTPSEVMAAAEPVIRAAVPDANVPVSVRSTGVPVGRGGVAELRPLVERWLLEHDEGTVGVVVKSAPPGVPAHPRVRVLTPVLAKGLEFDLVVLVEPLAAPEGRGSVPLAVDTYVAMTRATQRLVVLSG